MAGIKSGFITGARAKIKVGSKLVAFASDVSYDVRVETIPVEAMGKYEVFTNEPVGYYVNGSFTVVRYTAQDDSASSVLNQTAAGNPASSMGAKDANAGSDLSTHINPGQILSSSTFEMQIYEKLTDGTDQLVYQVGDCRITNRRAALNKRGVLMDSYTFVGVLAGDHNPAGTSYDVSNSAVGNDGD